MGAAATHLKAVQIYRQIPPVRKGILMILVKLEIIGLYLECQNTEYNDWQNEQLEVSDNTNLQMQTF